MPERPSDYGEFDSQVDVLARSFLAIGIDTGDRIGIWSPNSAEWVLIQYAAARIGAILVNLNPAYRTQEIHYALGQSQCRLLFAATSYKTSDYVAMIDAVRPHVSTLERVVFLGTESWADLLTAAAAAPNDAVRRREVTLQFDDPVNIQYTSGTTGYPKGATLSHHNILNNGYFVGEGCRYTEMDRVCIPVPFYHCFGMVLGNLACTTHGAAIVVPAPTFDAADTLHTVQTERCTSLYGVPTMFIAELALPDFNRYDLSSLRTGIMAGSPCPIEVMKQCVTAMHMKDVTICYGMTETSPARTGEDRRRDRSSGLDAHRRPGDHGRGRLRQYRRADQGHDHPRRGERVPARDRGVPLHASRRPGRAGDRRSRSEIRRGDHGVGKATPWCRALERRRSACVLRKPDCALQNPAVRAHRR